MLFLGGAAYLGVATRGLAGPESAELAMAPASAPALRRQGPPASVEAERGRVLRDLAVVERGASTAASDAAPTSKAAPGAPGGKLDAGDQFAAQFEALGYTAAEMEVGEESLRAAFDTVAQNGQVLLGYRDEKDLRLGQGQTRPEVSAAPTIAGNEVFVAGEKGGQETLGTLTFGVQPTTDGTFVGAVTPTESRTLTPEELASLSALGYGGGEGAALGGRAGAAPRELPRSETAGSYRGPGDSAPPSRTPAGGPGSPGPNSPGPAGLETPTTAGLSFDTNEGSSNFFLGRGEDADGESGLRRRYLNDDSRGVARLGRSAGDDALLGEILEALGLEQSDLGDLLEGLGYLDPSYAGDLSDEVGREAVRRFVDVKRAELLRQRAEEELARLLADCRRRPGESLDAMFFRHWGERPFVDAASDPLSTFAVDVDTASYALARKMLMSGVLPTREQIRTEEFVNYFDADVAAPTDDVFAIHSDLAPSAFGGGPDTWMLRVAVAGKEVLDDERKPLSLTFVIDTSGSMKREDRLGLVKDTLRQLLTKLDSRDFVTIIGFANQASLVLPRTSAANRGVVEAAILSLAAEGGTSVESGLTLGYSQAVEALDPNVNHRVVLLSDGVGNIGETDQERLLEKVAGSRAKGVYLNTIGSA